MLVVRAERPGGPEVLTVTEVAAPIPRSDELLVDVAAAGVNFVDTYRRSGMYPMAFPHVVGVEGAGVVTAVGDQVVDFAVGDRVAWVDAFGSYAQQHVVPAARALRVPDGLDLTQAAAVALQGITAQFLVTSTYPVQQGDTVLVHAAAGGVGLLLVQLSRAKGATVIGTVSTEDKERRARDMGANHVIRYTEVDDVAAEVRKLTDGVGVSVVYDGVGKDTFDASMASLRRRGMLVLSGAASGRVPAFEPHRLQELGSLYLTRPTIGDYAAEDDELRSLAARRLRGRCPRQPARSPLAMPYRSSRAADAHRALEGRQTMGKLILLPS